MTINSLLSDKNYFLYLNRNSKISLLTLLIIGLLNTIMQAAGWTSICGNINASGTLGTDASGNYTWQHTAGGILYEIAYNPLLCRWEIRENDVVQWYNTSTTTPHPPCSSVGIWVQEAASCPLTSVDDGRSGACATTTNSATICSGHCLQYESLEQAQFGTGAAFFGTNTTTLTINKPAGTVLNDLLLLAISTDGNVTFSTPSGWTELQQLRASGSAASLGIYYKIATVSEPADYTITWSSEEEAVATIIRYSGIDTANPINTFSTQTGNNTSPTAPSITTTANDVMVVRIYGADDDRISGSPYPAGLTPRVNILSADGWGTSTLGIADVMQIPIGATGTAAFALAETQEWAAATIALNPACPIGEVADYTIDEGGTITTCSGIFADAGNLNFNYGDNESHIITFCSNETNHLSFTFEHFNTEAGNDVLNIYDGNTTGATLIGAYSGYGENQSPGVVTSSSTCLTFEFLSNGSSNSLGWKAAISCTGLPPIAVGGGNVPWTGYPTNTACSTTTQISGRVFEDNDTDGIIDDREAYLKNIIVTIFDDNGVVNTTVTDASGAYNFSGLTAATVYRIEFTVPSNMKEGPYGAASGTAVQFVESGRCDANLGLLDPAHYCDQNNPYLAIPCYNNGDPLHSSNTSSTGIARFEYADSGESPAASYVNYVTYGTIGTTWGVAYDGNENNLYMSTVLKRHAGIGPGGIGAIYMHADGTSNTSAPIFYDFGAAAGTVANNTTRFPGSGTSFGQVGACGPCDNIDPTTFNQVAKVGFGDIDLNTDKTKLYVSNLYDRKIYTIDLNNPLPGSATPLPNIPWLNNAPCANGVARPWALEWRRGKLYVGVVCDASLSSCAIGSACSDLTANIFSFDGTTWTTELSFSLDYYRQAYSRGSNYFVKWIDDWNTMSPYVANKTDANFAQPIIMDLELDDDNSLIIGIGDRTGFQLGYQAPPPTGPSGSTAERNMAFGDVLRAAYDSNTATFTIENNGVAGSLVTTNPTGNSGPGGKSFYWGDYWTGIGANTYQGGIGALAMLPNSGEVMSPLADAINYYSNGISWMKNTNGATSKRLEVYQGVANGDSPFFAKSAGVGDMELFCEAPPIEIGNIVWWDEDADGLQDPSEAGIDGVTLELWLDPNGSAQGNNPLDGTAIKVAQTTTDAYGRYIFSYSGNSNGLSAENWSFTAHNKVLPDTFYQVRIANWVTNTPIVNHALAMGYSVHKLSPTQNQIGTTGAGGVERDNNSYDNPGNAASAVHTGVAGDNDHNFDFAFSGVGSCTPPNVVPTANTPCEGDTIQLFTAVSNGESPYVFSWSGPNGFSSTNQNPFILNADSDLHTGIYNLTVTDALDCSDTVHIHIAINNIDISTSPTDATCGNNDGLINLEVQSLAPVIIDWDNDGTGDEDDTEDLSFLAAGAYTVTVTDANGCSASATSAVGSTGSVLLTQTLINETCSNSNGSIDLTITGTPTTIAWNTGATTEDIAGLSAGTYSVTVNNAANCPAVLSVILTDTPSPTITISEVAETCSSSNGSIDVSLSGGTAPFTYDWDIDGVGDFDDAQNLTNLSNGTYTLVVRDANNCTASTSVLISDSDIPVIGATQTAETCGNSNGTIDLTVTGTSGPYNYSWNNGLTSEDISGLGAGTYSVTILDTLGCIFTATEIITDIVGPTITTTPANATDCNSSDGSVDLTVIGGTPTYTYDWSNDGFETIDNDTEDLTSLPAGTYTAIVTDNNGCSASISTGLLNTNDPVLDIAVVDPTNCGDTGAVDLTITNGTTPYTIDWSNDGLGDNDDMEDLANLEGGVYTLVVTDADGCTSQGAASIKVVRSPALNEILTLSTCGNSDGTIALNIYDPDAGISPVYTFDWDNDGIGDNDDTQGLTGIAAGNYSVTVSNNINCSTTYTVSLPDNGAPTISNFQTNPTCSSNDGTIDILVTGGTPAYSYNWSDGNTNEDLSGLLPGTYQVTVTDANGCKAPATMELVSTELPVLEAIIAPRSCDKVGDAAIDLSISGIEPFTIDWNNDGTGDNDDVEDLLNLMTGNYSVIVTDLLGCQNTLHTSVGSRICCENKVCLPVTMRIRRGKRN